MFGSHMRGRIVSAFLVLAVAFAAIGVLPVEQAGAAAWTKRVYAPKQDGDEVVGRGNVSIDDACEGTFGCYAYIKIEYKYVSGYEDTLVVQFDEWVFLEGDWADNGMNEIRGDLQPGCHDYRVVVDTYNDVDGDNSVSVGYGPVEIEFGDGIVRRHKETVSKTVEFCQYA